MEKVPKEICTIRIIFPVESDEQAIEVKKKIAETLSGIPDIQIQFMIMGNFANGSQIQHIR